MIVFNPSSLQPASGQNVDEYLKEAATASTQLLINQIFELPTRAEKGVIGRIVTLPKGTTHLPREKPLPEKKVVSVCGGSDPGILGNCVFRRRQSGKNLQRKKVFCVMFAAEMCSAAVVRMTLDRPQVSPRRKSLRVSSMKPQKLTNEG